MGTYIRKLYCVIYYNRVQREGTLKRRISEAAKVAAKVRVYENDPTPCLFQSFRGDTLC